MRGRLCEQDHATAESILKDPNASVRYYPVTPHGDDVGRSLKVAEQKVMALENVRPGKAGPNKIPALGPKKLDKYSKSYPPTIGAAVDV
jgi:hypothetical protein